MSLLATPKHVHLVGIKGVGMTALAQVLVHRGHHVTGSDVPERFFTDPILERLKIQVSERFLARNVPPRAQVLIHSAAYTDQNPEIREAKVRGIHILVYPEALGELSHAYYAIGVAGMHGKSTTTAMLGQVLAEHAMDPTVICGTQVPAFGNMNARVGSSPLLVAETCEYRRHFLHYASNAAIITNIEPEHLDYYRDLDDILDAYASYVGRITPWQRSSRERIDENGKLVAPVGIPPLLVACTDDPGVRTLLARLPEIGHPDLHVVPYGFDEGAACRASNLRIVDGIQTFDVTLHGKELGSFALQVPGRMNVLNALAVIAMTHSLSSAVTGKVPTARTTRQGLLNFLGTTRRFHHLGTAAGVVVIDDYAHHPTEIRATIEAATQRYPGARIWVDFMPHTFSRTQALFADFAHAFSGAYGVVLNKIYASKREHDDGSVSGASLAQEAQKHHERVRFAPTVEDAAGVLLPELQSGDVLIVVGAGDSWRVGQLVLEGLRKR